MQEFIQKMPKAELHVHIEGTLEPELSFALAQKNGVSLSAETPEQMIAAYNFHDLPSFLDIYYAGMSVLIEEEDFYALTMAYFEKAAAQHIVYVELFFDPQAHTSRGVAFDTVIEGIYRAQQDANTKLGVQSNLILCFLRDMSADSAMEHLIMAEPHLNKLIGVGLDSDEHKNPPSKFAAVFAKAREWGLKLTMHCDVNQQDTLEHIRQVLEDIDVDRIDHGVNILASDALCELVKQKNIGLTVCPVSNQFVVQSLTSIEIKDMLKRGLMPTINSDDPSYFRAYLNENLIALQQEGGFSEDELSTLVANSFKASWLSTSEKEQYLAGLNDYLAKCA
ncbi:adenosine deaminase [Alteromonas stellipolaris]|jgi:adenosine deaminase|uniref:adenosine deaminase n=1 Tax=Alteromonas stellipolaris TaxID=233316 RepID=UPI00076FED6E|nr:adenosine deaminase [Alteromonas stellipolaris]AMJ94079.1 adenosine deaminase [Alteromonas stellipolaris]ANB26910.1 adenosine deaminase [Alteromonas stellipolaris]MDO6535470.1 adenosine deaminase [Alteromonas stellipolaris]MDO6627346.1 adenosine deaminase [Alteromonas stellipolaris]